MLLFLLTSVCVPLCFVGGDGGVWCLECVSIVEVVLGGNLISGSSWQGLRGSSVWGKLWDWALVDGSLV